MREVYFHEDDYCQLELVAAADADFCLRQMRQIEAFSNEHRDGEGWNDVLVRSAAPTPLSSLGISRGEFVESIPASLPAFDRVLTGYGSQSIVCKRTLAFGPHTGLVAFADVGEDDCVFAVWFTLDLTTPDDVDVALQLTKSLSRWPAALADWGWNTLLPLTESDVLTRYFRKRIEVFGS